jgi:hypothetical protein
VDWPCLKRTPCSVGSVRLPIIPEMAVWFSRSPCYSRLDYLFVLLRCLCWEVCLLNLGFVLRSQLFVASLWDGSTLTIISLFKLVTNCCPVLLTRSLNFYIGAFILTCLISLQWMVSSFLTGFQENLVPIVSKETCQLGNLLGTVILNFAFTTIAPSWINVNTYYIHAPYSSHTSLYPLHDCLTTSLFSIFQLAQETNC